MALTINTNIDSLNAQNSLGSSQSLLSQSLTRLSSGLKINTAADDAAGLAISQQFTTQVNGTNQAINNANNAVSEAQTAGGALTTIVSNLQSIRTLAVEAANGSMSTTDRTALNGQVQQQIAEITQIAQQTSFNGSNVLNGSAGTTVYQVGANVGDTISVNLTQGVAANQIGQYATKSFTMTGSALTAGGLGLQVGSSPTVGIGAAVAGSNTVGQATTSAYATAASINAAGISGLTATATTTETSGSASVTGSVGATYSLSINGVSIYPSGGDASGGITQGELMTQINSKTASSGVAASLNGAALQLTAADGSNIVIAESGTAFSGSSGLNVSGETSGASTDYGSVTLSAASPITVTGTSTIFGASGTTIAATTGVLSSANVSSVSAANAMIQSVDSALATVSAFQSQLGAIQNRFTAAVSNLTSTAQNLTQSRSTIQDANFAQETANLTQAQVLMQAGISVLAQANQEPQLVLKLLQ